MIEASVLVVAKAPVPGLAKTRLAATIGDAAAADVAAAALLDTLDAVAATPVATRVVALTGDLGAAARADDLRGVLADFVVVPQRGEDFAERLINAHADASAAAGGLPVLQIGMDTPQVTAGLLTDCAATLTGCDALLGLAPDGGWWVLGIRTPEAAECLRTVPMSHPETGARTRAALEAIGLDVTLVEQLADVDTIDDVDVVRGACESNSRFRRLAVR